MMDTNIVEAMIEQARMLRSEHGENPEYDRALTELVGYTLGFSSDDFWLVEKAIDIKHGRHQLMPLKYRTWSGSSRERQE